MTAFRALPAGLRIATLRVLLSQTMHRDTRTLLFHILFWGIAAGAFWSLYAIFPSVYDSLFPHATTATEAAVIAEEQRLHELHIGLWRSVVLYLAIFASVGTFLAAMISAFNVLRYEKERSHPATSHP